MSFASSHWPQYPPPEYGAGVGGFNNAKMNDKVRMQEVELKLHEKSTIRFSDPRFTFFKNTSGHILLFSKKHWPSAEHLYQALKFADPAIRRRIRRSETTEEARAVARKYSDLRKPDWSSVSYATL